MSLNMAHHGKLPVNTHGSLPIKKARNNGYLSIYYLTYVYIYGVVSVWGFIYGVIEEFSCMNLCEELS